MVLTHDEILHVARLARLGLTAAEVARLKAELDTVLGWAARLDELDLEGVPVFDYAGSTTESLRADRVVSDLGREAVLAGAPDTEADHFRVPRMVGD